MVVLLSSLQREAIFGSVSLTDFAKIKEAKGQTSQYKAPGTLHCTMLPPSGKEIENKS